MGYSCSFIAIIEVKGTSVGKTSLRGQSVRSIMVFPRLARRHKTGPQAEALRILEKRCNILKVDAFYGEIRDHPDMRNQVVRCHFLR